MPKTQTSPHVTTFKMYYNFKCRKYLLEVRNRYGSDCCQIILARVVARIFRARTLTK
jgi:hypothetical protein